MRRAVLVVLVLGSLLARVPDAGAQGRKAIAIRMPRVTLPASSNVELCYFLRVPATSAFLAGSWQLVNTGARGGTQPSHALAYLYVGESLAGFPSGQLVQSRGCLDLGPADRDRRVLVATSSSPKVVRRMPTGVAIELAPVPDAPGGPPAGIGILLDVNWSNDEPRPRTVSTRLVLRRVASGRANRIARPLRVSGDAALVAPPFGLRAPSESGDGAWTPAADACVLGLSGQMHRRGQCLGIDHLDAGGVVKPPAAGQVNSCTPDRRRQLFVGSDWTDPGALGFTTPLPVRAGEALRFGCWVDNGGPGGATLRLGCETSPGVTPGAIGAPAASCTAAVAASAECPGNAACVPANVVAGPGFDDELCGLTALVYDAAPGGGCDVSEAP